MTNHISTIKNLISSRIKMNVLFKIKDVSKRRGWHKKLQKAVIIPIDIHEINKCYKSIQKAVRIPVEIHETNKKFTFTVQPKNACKLEFVDHLWIPFIDQPQLDIVVFFRYITL